MGAWTMAERSTLLERIIDGDSVATALRSVGRHPMTLVRLRRGDVQFERMFMNAVSRGSRLNGYLRRVRPIDDSCSVVGCRASETRALGLCERHYFQQYRTGRIGSVEQTYGRTGCATPGCDRPHRARGWCIGCYDLNMSRRTA